MAEAVDSGGGSERALAGIALAVLLGIFGCLVFFLLKMNSAQEQPEAKQSKGGRGAASGGQRKRGALDRMQQGAARAAAAASAAEGQGDASEDEDDAADDRGQRRNQQKDQRKQEKRAQQHAERHIRQERESAKAEKQTKYSQKQKEKEAERQRLEEEEKKAREEKQQKEQEEFDQWKEMFAVEAEGEEENGMEENAVENFIDYIKVRKVVNLEDIAADFKMRTTAVIDRIGQLEKLERLSGIFDDRGKYVYISKEEFAAVAAWLKKTGRIGRSDLVAACNRLVRLNPTEEDKAKLAQEARSAAEDLEGATETTES